MGTGFLNGCSDVATVSTLIRDELEARKWLMLTNDSDTIVYIAFGAAAVMNSGSRLEANGGRLILTPKTRCTAAIYGIHGAAGTKGVLFAEAYHS